MVHIQISKSIQMPVNARQLDKAVLETLRFTGSSTDSEITLVFTDDAQLQKLNKNFLGIDEPTDVLSFPADFIDPDSEHPYLGDILISVPRAAEQAYANQQTLLAEIMLLTVHGTLHLLGFDHAEETDKDRMWQAQNSILNRLKNF
jgi:probable rRNA maturation factor